MSGGFANPVSSRRFPTRFRFRRSSSPSLSSSPSDFSSSSDFGHYSPSRRGRQDSMLSYPGIESNEADIMYQPRSITGSMLGGPRVHRPMLGGGFMGRPRINTAPLGGIIEAPVLDEPLITAVIPGCGGLPPAPLPLPLPTPTPAALNHLYTIEAHTLQQSTKNYSRLLTHHANSGADARAFARRAATAQYEYIMEEIRRAELIQERDLWDAREAFKV